VAPNPAHEIEKLDLRRQYRALYAPSAKKVQVVDVPDLQYIRLDGVIEPGVGPSDSGAFRQAMEAMYAVAYGLKFMSKLRQVDPIDFTVMAVEGLWSIEPGRPFDPTLLTDFTLLMLQPDHISQQMLQSVVSEATVKRPNPALRHVTLVRWREGLCIQIMHIGPYSDEPRTLDAMAEYAAERGYRLRGRHHEIYLGDPRRAQPQNLKTILRHPIES
jgi:hypothetical protein